MKRLLTACILFLLFTTSAYSQDTVRVINQEIGFNTVSLIKQVISNNPASTLQQLPYDIFYNIYYKNTVGLRLGLGLNNSHTSTEIDGQIIPKTSDQNQLNFRAGISYNFVKSRKIDCNVFGDFLLEKVNFETSTTTTNPGTFPNPGSTRIINSGSLTKGTGVEVGVGVKYNFNKHLSIYAEVPIVFMNEKNKSTTYIYESGVEKTTTDRISISSTRIILPTTIYFVLRF